MFSYRLIDGKRKVGEKLSKEEPRPSVFIDKHCIFANPS
jgi:hypothetical protein